MKVYKQITTKSRNYIEIPCPWCEIINLIPAVREEGDPPNLCECGNGTIIVSDD